MTYKTELDLIAEEVLSYNASNTGTKLFIPGCFISRAAKAVMSRENGLLPLMEATMSDFESEMEAKVVEGLEDDDKSVAFHSAAMAIGARVMYELEYHAWSELHQRVMALRKKAVAA